MLGASAFGLVGCTSSPTRFLGISISLPLQEAEKTPEKPKLYVNTDSKNHYVLQKNWNEGIRDIIELTETSSVEEYWLYNVKTEEWIEAGVKEHRSGVFPHYDALAHAGRKYKELLFDLVSVHSHLPDLPLHQEKPTDGRLHQNLPTQLFKPIDTYLSSLSEIFPSDADCATNYSFDIKTWAVVSRYGVMECTNTGQRIATLTSDSKLMTSIWEQCWANDDWGPIWKNIGLSPLALHFRSAGKPVTDLVPSLLQVFNKKFAGRIGFEFHPRSDYFDALPPQ